MQHRGASPVAGPRASQPDGREAKGARRVDQRHAPATAIDRREPQGRRRVDPIYGGTGEPDRPRVEEQEHAALGEVAKAEDASDDPRATIIDRTTAEQDAPRNGDQREPEAEAHHHQRLNTLAL
jgi:hypothetical protein